MCLILLTSYIHYNVLSVQCIVGKAYIGTLAWENKDTMQFVLSLAGGQQSWA